jgi:hypothetical protein
MDRKKDKHSSNGRRGPNAKTKKDMVKEMPKTFLEKSMKKRASILPLLMLMIGKMVVFISNILFLVVGKSIGLRDQKQLGLMKKVLSMLKM